MKPLTELDLLWHKDPLTIEDAAILLSGTRDSSAAGTATTLLATDIKNRKLRAKIVRWTEYDWDYGGEVDRGRGNINEYKTTIRMTDFKAYCKSKGLRVVDENLSIAKTGALIDITPAPAANEESKANLSSNGEKWQEQARIIADEYFNRDTANGCRDSLQGYCVRVMELMQQRDVKGPRGIFDSPGTIKREALQSKKWWANKSK